MNPTFTIKACVEPSFPRSSILFSLSSANSESVSVMTIEIANCENEQFAKLTNEQNDSLMKRLVQESNDFDAIQFSYSDNIGLNREGFPSPIRTEFISDLNSHGAQVVTTVDFLGIGKSSIFISKFDFSKEFYSGYVKGFAQGIIDFPD